MPPIEATLHIDPRQRRPSQQKRCGTQTGDKETSKTLDLFLHDGSDATALHTVPESADFTTRAGRSAATG